MRVLLCKLCEYVCKLENGRHNLVGVFDDIRIPNVPLDHPPFFLVFQLEFEKDEMGQKLEVAVRLVDPANKEILRSDLSGEVPHHPTLDQVRMFFFSPIQPIRLEQQGDYRLIISNQGDIVHIEHIPVIVLPPPPGG